jgi:REP element-mobilizing transposase RayT
VEQWRREQAWAARVSAPESHKAAISRRIAQYEDAGHGACWLRDERIAALVEQALLHFDGKRYQLLAWCIMPNHVHALVETCEGWPLASVLHSWKSYTAHLANQALQQTGEFWFREYHDRFIRDEAHFNNALSYIEGNPVVAGLAGSKDDWRWSSAWRQRQD